MERLPRTCADPDPNQTVTWANLWSWKVISSERKSLILICLYLILEIPLFNSSCGARQFGARFVLANHWLMIEDWGFLSPEYWVLTWGWRIIVVGIPGYTGVARGRKWSEIDNVCFTFNQQWVLLDINSLWKNAIYTEWSCRPSKLGTKVNRYY